LILGVDRMSGEMTTPAITPGGFASFGGFGGGLGVGFSMARFDGAFDDGVSFQSVSDDDVSDDGWSFDEGLVDILDLPLIPGKVKEKVRECTYTLERGV